jgi:hypothetical protein
MKPILDMIGTDYVIMEMVERTYGTTGIEWMEEYITAETPVLTRPGDYPDVD